MILFPGDFLPPIVLSMLVLMMLRSVCLLDWVEVGLRDCQGFCRSGWEGRAMTVIAIIFLEIHEFGFEL